jgi:hypothetical protein
VSANDFNTLWIQRIVNQIAATKALEVVQKTGRGLPCTVTAVNAVPNGTQVTVNFEVTGPWTLPQLTLPKQEAAWMRSPTQVGDVGMTVPADTFLGGVSGQGSGVADLSVDYGNLSSLVWVPIAATGFTAPPDPNKNWINGPAGVVFSDTEQTVPIDLDKATGKANIGALTGELDSVQNAAQRYLDQVQFVASIKQMVGNALQQAAQSAIASSVPNAAAWLAEIQGGLPSLSFTDLSSSIAALEAPAGSRTVLLK